MKKIIIGLVNLRRPISFLHDNWVSSSAVDHWVMLDSILSTLDVAKAVKPSGNVQNVKEKSVNGVQPSIPSADAGKFVEELLARASALMLSEVS